MSTYTNTAPTANRSMMRSVAQASVALFSTAAIVVLTGLIALGLFQASYAQRIYPGLTFWGADLSGLTREEARNLMTQRFNYVQASQVTLRDGGRNWTGTPGQLGLMFDVDATVARAFNYGRSGDWQADLEAQWAAWYGGNYSIPPVIVYDQSQARQFVRQVATEVDKPPVEATLEIRGTEVVVTPGEYGRTVDIEATLAALEVPLRNISTVDVALVVDEYSPNVLDATEQAELARRILSAPLELRADGDLTQPAPWVFDQATLAQMLVIRTVTADDGDVTYAVGLDDVQFVGFLDSIQDAVTVDPENARFIFNDDTRQLDLLEEAVIGRALNIDATVAAVNEQLLRGAHQVTLVFDTQTPEINNETTAADLGITGLVSSQTTYFAGSSAERINNIGTGAATMHGVLVPPGGTFSFNDFLGDISLDTGFSEALIIYGGRTIKGVGGGICQVSTTAFRAAFFGGYPIVTRHSHAYRVGYYEQGGYGPGLDATIFTPVVDFQFENDRDSWLLVETYFSPDGRWLQYKFYSGQDDRRVVIGDPIVTNVVEHAPPVWEENPELEPGEVKQVDWAADGMDVLVQRTITMADGSVVEDEIRTHYEPWRAVCQYGPGTDLTTVENLPAQCTLPEDLLNEETEGRMPAADGS